MRISRLFVIAAFTCAIASVACNTSTSPTPPGKLTVHVTKTDNTGVALAHVDLYKIVQGSATLWRAAYSSSNGTAIFGAANDPLEAGSYYVRVSFTNNFQLVSGETNDKTVTLVSGQDVEMTFHAEAVGLTPPPPGP